jgi:hypothetical protein
MKKILILFMAIVFTIPSFCQDKSDVSPDKNVLKINTLSLFLGTGSIFYERKLSDNTSGQMGVSFLSYRFSSTKFSGLILTPEFRIYPRKNAIEGFYVAPYLRYFTFTIKSTTNSDKGTLDVIGGGFLLGRQWITNSGFTMDLFFGGHYGSSSIKTDSGNSSWVDSNIFSGFRTRVGFALGFAF